MATDIRLDAIASVRGELGNVRTGASEEFATLHLLLNTSQAIGYY